MPHKSLIPGMFDEIFKQQINYVKYIIFKLIIWDDIRTLDLLCTTFCSYIHGQYFIIMHSKVAKSLFCCFYYLFYFFSKTPRIEMCWQKTKKSIFCVYIFQQKFVQLCAQTLFSSKYIVDRLWEEDCIKNWEKY